MALVLVAASLGDIKDAMVVGLEQNK